MLIARALASSPDLLLFDEPTANVDTTAGEKLYEILDELNERMTILIVSHDIGFVNRHISSVVCVNQQVVVHPTSALAGQNIIDLYGNDMALIRHDHRCAAGRPPMLQFLSDLQQFRFLQYALLTGLMASVACGIIGSYVTVRRITYIAGAIAHCTLGGMGIAGYLQREQGLTFLSPLAGAVCAALLAALVISYMLHRSTMRLDTILSAVWAIGMAVGIIFISKTGGYNKDLMSYLFGDILMVSDQDLMLISVLDLILIGDGIPALQPPGGDQL